MWLEFLILCSTLLWNEREKFVGDFFVGFCWDFFEVLIILYKKFQIFKNSNWKKIVCKFNKVFFRKTIKNFKELKLNLFLQFSSLIKSTYSSQLSNKQFFLPLQVSMQFRLCSRRLSVSYFSILFYLFLLYDMTSEFISTHHHLLECVPYV
jgi:hypothetical protein